LVRREALFVFSKEDIGMARIFLRQLLDHAAEHSYGVPAFNIADMEQALAVMDAASVCNAPVIVQASRGARSYASDIMLRHMVDALTEIHPQIPLCVHLDHGNEPAACLTAIQAGFNSVMMDARSKRTPKRRRTGTATSRSPRP
jgi:fructose-bisphosphate aldolase, class II